MALSESALKSVLSRLESANSKVFTDVQNRRLIELLVPLDATTASLIASEIELIENIPKNIVAVVVKAIERLKQNAYDRTVNATSWKADELCTNSTEFSLFFGIMGYTMKLHASGKVKSNGEADQTILDIDAWVSSGRPKTWSPIVDKFLAGYERVYKNRNACVEYLQRFYEFLKSEFK